MPAPVTAQFEELVRRAPSLSPVELLPTLRSMIETHLRCELREAGIGWPGDLASAIHEYGELRRLSKLQRHDLHEVRMKANLVLHESYQPSRAVADQALATVGELLGVAVDEAAPREALPVAVRVAEAPSSSTPVDGPVVSVVVVDVDETRGLLLVEQWRPGDGYDYEAVPLRVRPPAAFTSLVRPSSRGRKLNLIDVARDAGSDLLLPRIVVLEPDYLVDVTAIAGCAQRKGANPNIALLNAFTPDDTSLALVFGNVVNALLDRVLSEVREGRQLDFDRFVREELFQLAPLALSSLAELESNEGVRALVDDLERHFAAIVRSKDQDFVVQAPGYKGRRKVDLVDVVLEPSFLSARYGIQGRLDLLHSPGDGYDVVELKSGRRIPDRPDMAWENHAAQARLYQLLLEDKHGDEARKKGQTSILYSAAGAEKEPLRHVTSAPEHAVRLMSVRNEIVARELALAGSRGPSDVAAALEPFLDPACAGDLPPYQIEKARRVAARWSEADEVERAWALEMVRFVARELRDATLGPADMPGAAVGTAALWNATDRAKITAGRLLDRLRVAREGDRLILTILPALPDDEDAGANFREGDALLLYPRHRTGAPDGERLGPLNSQILKCFLEKIEPGRLTVSIRNRLVSSRFLEDNDLWALEPDTYDTYRREWSGISAFLSLPEDRRKLLLGRTPPRKPASVPSDDPVEAALAAPDWYLLSGPPGTGKTSGALRRMVGRLVESGASVLVAAYTNRAVDEICKYVEELGVDYLRVGTELGADPRYRPRLLEKNVEGLRSRRDVKARLAGCNVYVGTVSSLVGKKELFGLKQFDVAIVDEASQILEVPMLALLGRVPKFILIGDHKQLPAVVAQDEESSRVSREAAPLLERELGMSNLRNSYFERMLARARGRWGWAHGTLQKQYRMHEEIMGLVNRRFYDGVLECGEPSRQRAPLARDGWPPASGRIGEALRKHRLLFVAAMRTDADRSFKECHEEARAAADAIEAICRGLGRGFDPGRSAGVIASYRNQVALIRRELARRAASDPALETLAGVTVDTVERFQGSDRDVIVASICCQFPWQLDQLVSSSDPLGGDERIDRKLNVILTRAREQLVLVGNPDVLSRDDCYRSIVGEIRAAGALVEA